MLDTFISKLRISNISVADKLRGFPVRERQIPQPTIGMDENEFEGQLKTIKGEGGTLDDVNKLIETAPEITNKPLAKKKAEKHFGPAQIGLIKTAQASDEKAERGFQMRDEQKQKIDIPSRGVSFTPDDISELRNVLFAEVSNRSNEKRQFEARHIINTAINRMNEFAKRGQPKTLTEVLSQPNQYQGYGTEQYQMIKSGKLDELSREKAEAIDKIIAELTSGEFEDTTDGAVYYVHDDQGRLWLKDGTLFK